QAHPTGTCVHEGSLTRLDLMRTRRQVLRGQTLQRHRRSHLGGHALRNPEHEDSPHYDLRRIRTPAFAPRHSVTDLPALNALAHLGDIPRALDADDVRVIHRIHTRTTVRVDEIHARSLDVDEHLAGAGLRSLDLTELKDFRSTGLHRTNCLGHDASCI